MIKKKTLLLIPALLVLMLVWAAPAHSTGPDGEWHTWEVQGDYGPNWDQNYAQAFDEPQVHVGEGQIAPECETWVQIDFYPYAAQENGKSIAEVIEDGLLDDGEDWHLTSHSDGHWWFQYGGPCPEPEPSPEPEVTPVPTPTPDPQEDVAPPALPVEAEATFTG